MNIHLRIVQTYCKILDALDFTDETKFIAVLGILHLNSMNTPEYQASILKYGRTAANEISRRLKFA